MGGHRMRTATGINKGVGHNIRKPNLKAKEKARNPAKFAVRRLRQLQPPPRLAVHRASTTLKNKRHVLSTPGVSLLETPEVDLDESVEKTNGKIFFTSRASGSASVKITKNVVLSASYGTVSLQQRSNSVGFRKNIGGASVSYPTVCLASLPESLPPYLSFDVGSKPTRFLESPAKHSFASHTPVRQSPRKFAASANYLLPAKNSPKKPVNTSVKVPVRSSPRRHTPVKEPVRSSPRRHTLVKEPVNSSPRRQTPVKEPVRSSPRRQTPVKEPVRSSPRYHTPTRTLRHTPSKLEESPSSHWPVENGLIPMRKKLAFRNALLHIFHESPDKMTDDSENAEGSPHRVLLRESPFRTKNRLLTLNESPFKALNCEPGLNGSPLRRTTASALSASPLKAMNKVVALKSGNSPKSSPLKDHNGCLSSSLFLENSPRSPYTRNQSSLTSPDIKKKATESCKKKLTYFPIFDPEKRKSHDEQPSTLSTKQRYLRTGPDQLVLDAGQSKFGAAECKQCGLIYEYGHAEDERMHDAYHNRVNNVLTLHWKKERQVTVRDSRGGRCLMVVSSDPPHCWRKVHDVLALVNEELDYAESSAPLQESWVFFYVVAGKVAGCLVAEQVSWAHRVVPDADKENELLCCAEDAVPCKFGISRIWVRGDERRKGIASKLVDAFRANILPCHYLKIDDFAFSDPTPVGMQFARSYTKKRDFLVFRNSF